MDALGVVSDLRKSGQRWRKMPGCKRGAEKPWNRLHASPRHEERGGSNAEDGETVSVCGSLAAHLQEQTSGVRWVKLPGQAMVQC